MKKKKPLAKAQQEDFLIFVLEQLVAVPGLVSKRMFGGVGLYQEETFFGILYKGRLFFKTSESSRQSYLDYGMPPFQPNEKQTLKSYYAVPVEILEDRERLSQWAEAAIETAKDLQ